MRETTQPCESSSEETSLRTRTRCHLLYSLVAGALAVRALACGELVMPLIFLTGVVALLAYTGYCLCYCRAATPS